MDTALNNVTFTDVTTQMGLIWGSLIIVGLIAAYAGIGLAFKVARKVKGMSK